ncbi:MAG: PQQ-binding-like beta-propeller repeat protein [Limisphaerales bacterium]
MTDPSSSDAVGADVGGAAFCRCSAEPSVACHCRSSYQGRVITPFNLSPSRQALFLGGVLACLTVDPTALAQENWPGFRGPGARGVGESAKLPIAWGTGTNIAWRTPIPGRGWSSPIVWGDRIFLTTAVSEGELEAPKKGLYFGGDRAEPPPHRHQWRVLGLDAATGKVLWSTEVKAASPTTPVHIKNTYASETPVTDGERVFAYFGTVGLFALDFEGKVLWSQPVPARKMAHGWGTASSPILHDGRVLIVNDNEEASFMAAFDARTGRELWRVARDEPSNWSTPYVWEHQGRAEIVVTGRNKVRGYDLDGKPHWELKGMSTITIPTPFSADGLLYVAAGYVGDRLNPNKPVYAIRPGASGDLTLAEGERSSAHVAWMEPNSSPYNPSPLVVDGRFYVLWDFGFLSCRDAATGREIYDKQRIEPDGTVGFTASPWAYRGRVFCLSEDGDTYVFKAGDEAKLERVNALGEMCMATPALAGDSLYIRSLSHLHRVREKP